MREKTALITGGASGIGRAIAEEMARNGARVALADRDVALAEEVAEGIRATGGDAEVHELDVRDASRFRAVADAVRARNGRIDYLFNNAGIGVGGEVHEYDRAAWDDVLDVNVRGVAYGVNAVYPEMIAQGSGHIINTASMAGLMPGPGMASYTTSKHAVVGMTKALRIEGAAHGVRVSALCPGAIRTPILTTGKYGRQGPRRISEKAMLEQWEKARPMDPQVFAREALKRIRRNTAIIILPRWWRGFWLIDRVSPSLSLALAKRFHRDTQRLYEEGASAAPESDDPPRRVETR